MDNVFAFNTGDDTMLVSVSDPLWKRRLLNMRRKYRDIKITSSKGNGPLTAEVPISYLHILKSFSAKERKRYGKYDYGQFSEEGKNRKKKIIQ